MTEIYTVTLHRPMGPREGRLEMTYCGKLVKGTLSLLGYVNSVTGRRTGPEELCLSCRLDSVMGAIACDSVLHLIAGDLSGTADTSKGKMEWTGTLMETKV